MQALLDEDDYRVAQIRSIDVTHPEDAREARARIRESWIVGLLCLTPDGTTVLFSDDHRILRADAVTLAGRPTVQIGRELVVEAISPDGTLALGVSGHGFDLRAYDLRDGQCVRRFDSQEDGMADLAISPDGQDVAFGLYYENETPVRVHDMATGRERFVLRGFRSSCGAVKYAPGGRSLVTAAADGVLRIFDARSGALRITLEELPGGGFVAHTADGRYHASEGAEAFLRASDGDVTLTGEALAARLRDPEAVAAVLRACFAPASEAATPSM